ncbi:MAG: transcriptional repressor [Eubacteriales bacterium]|nr:transcriptional repressor [Eubacteriales bacterium]MDD4389398.1 transcriptional repressor [Eubacteriales bacterium]
MKKYKTKQRQQLTLFFENNYDKQFTISQLADNIEGIGTSSLYRNVNQLVSEGLVRRFQSEESRKFLYQYIGNSDCDQHFHLKCNKCGRIEHMDNNFSDLFIKIVKSGNNFDIDASRTILFGFCLSCKENEAEDISIE